MMIPNEDRQKNRVMEILDASMRLNEVHDALDSDDNDERDKLSAQEVSDIARLKNRGREKPIVENDVVVNEFVRKQEPEATSSAQVGIKKSAVYAAVGIVAAIVIVQNVLIRRKKEVG